MKSKPKTLSFESLMLIQDALDARNKMLENLHWQAVAFGATDPLYRNLAQYRAKIDKARSEVSTLFEEQYPKPQ